MEYTPTPGPAGAAGPVPPASPDGTAVPGPRPPAEAKMIEGHLIDESTREIPIIGSTGAGSPASPAVADAAAGEATQRLTPALDQVGTDGPAPQAPDPTEGPDALGAEPPEAETPETEAPEADLTTAGDVAVAEDAPARDEGPSVALEGSPPGTSADPSATAIATGETTPLPDAATVATEEIATDPAPEPTAGDEDPSQPIGGAAETAESSEVAGGEGVGVEPGALVATAQATGGPEQAEAGPASEDAGPPADEPAVPAKNEQAWPEPADAEPADAGPEARATVVEAAATEAAATEAEATEAEAKPVTAGAELVEAEAEPMAADAEPTDAEPTDAEPVEAQAERAETESVEAEAAGAEQDQTDIEAADAEGEPVEAQTAEAGTPEDEPVEAEAEAGQGKAALAAEHVAEVPFAAYAEAVTDVPGEYAPFGLGVQLAPEPSDAGPGPADADTGTDDEEEDLVTQPVDAGFVAIDEIAGGMPGLPTPGELEAEEELTDDVAASAQPPGEALDRAPELEPTEEFVAAAAASLARLRPGDLSDTRIAIWTSSGSADALRAKLRQAQATFVDDPEAAVREAKAVVTEAVNTLAATLAQALLDAHADLDPTETSAHPDTESLRVAIRGYRDFLERVLAL